MSTKDLFTRNYLTDKNEKDAFSEVESAENIKQVREKQTTFVPNVDYTDPLSFARYGSARLYYKSAIDRVVDFYPYDGSQAELNEFYNKSLDIEKYIFNNRYPRTTGYANFSPNGWGTATSRPGGYGSSNVNEYITFKAGPNSTSQTAALKSLIPDSETSTYQYSNIYDESLYTNEGLPSDYGQGTRTSNLKSNFDTGVTIEFWAKTGSLDTSLTEKQVIVDIWNNELSSSAHYGRITVELDGTTGGSTPWLVTVESGSTSVFQQSVGTDLSIHTLSDWKHYSFVLQNSGSDFHIKLYVDGQHNDTEVVSSKAVSEINPENLMGRIGALQTAPKGLEDVSKISNYSGAGKLSGSIDEFRFWKVARNPKQVGQNWFTQIRGGVNTDISNTTLGMYYKFNEGITNSSSLDSVVLDYGGRVCNGTWTGYAAASRNTGSAIVSASAAGSEYLDPIIYSVHPDVVSLKRELEDLGTFHDSQNNSMFLKSVPAWILEEAEDLGNSDLEKLTHIMGAYFDKLYLQIQAIPKLRQQNYVSSSDQPLPFSQNLPQSLGLNTPEIFIDSTVLEKFANRSDTKLFQEDLQETKNLIYQNIYNNLADIYKAKGTEKAIRNVLRCFNIDDNLIYLRAYSNNQLFELKNNLKQTQKKTRLLNLNKQTSTTAVVYQAADPSVTDARGFISGSEGLAYEDNYGFTAEVGVKFPKFFRSLDKIDREFINTVSIFGMHSASVDNPSETTIFSSDTANFQVQAVRDKVYSKNVFFRLSSSVTPFPAPLLTSSLYYNVYDDENWNLSVGLRPSKYPFVNISSGSEDFTYDFVFRGYNNKLGTVNNSFELTASVSKEVGQNFLRAAKRLYVGATNENITGSTNTVQSDVQYTDARYWTKYIDSYTLKQHSVDRENFGLSGSYRSIDPVTTPIDNQNSYNFNSLALDWFFETVTGSDAAGQFYVTDLSSGSALLRNNFGWAGQIGGHPHTGRGRGFQANDDQVAVNQIVNEFKFTEPEMVISSDMVQVLDEDDELLGTFDQVPNYVFVLEKSLYGAVSEEILDFFAGSLDFNNLIGDPVNRYRKEYKSLNYLRNIFFERFQKISTVEKYVDYYKWFDDALATIISQLVPASADFINDVYNTVESHVLERNKYQSQFPTIDFKQADPEASIRGIVETKLNYQQDLFGGVETSPRPTNVHKNFWRRRALPGPPGIADHEITSSDASVDTKRRKIRAGLYSRPQFSSSMPTLTKTDGTKYSLNRLLETQKAGTVDFSGPENVTINRTIVGGVNFEHNKDIHYTYASLYPAGPVMAPAGGVFVPQNVLYARTDDTNRVDTLEDWILDGNVGVKRKKHLKVVQGRDYNDGLGYTCNKNSFAFPFNVMSSSITGGVDDFIRRRTELDISITNLHNDVYGNEMEVPMQGPFTNYAVGGHQSRHIALNSGSDTYTNRPEAWKILLGVRGDCPDGEALTGAIGMAAPDYPWPEANDVGVTPYPMTASHKAVYYRDHIAKRPVNIKNIQVSTGSTILGNFEHKYEVVHSFGAFENPRNFIETQPSLPTNLFQSRATSSTQTRTFYDTRRSSGSHFEFMADYDVGYLSGTNNNTIITTKFDHGAGGMLTNGNGYRDFRSNEFSVYNSINNRFLSVKRRSQVSTGQTSEIVGSGTAGIRVFDIHGNDFGLTAHASRHTARFGRDSNLVSTPGASYVESPGFHKIHRNNKDCVRITNETLVPIFSPNLTLINRQGVAFASSNSNSAFLLTGALGGSPAGEPLVKSPDLLAGISGSGFSWTGLIKFHAQQTHTSPASETRERIWAMGLNSSSKIRAKLERVKAGSGDHRFRIYFTIGTTGGGGAGDLEYQWHFPAGTFDLSSSYNHYALVFGSPNNGVGGANRSIPDGQLNQSAQFLTSAVLYFNGVSQSAASISSNRPDYNDTNGSFSSFRGFAALKPKGQSYMQIGGGLGAADQPLSASIDEFTFWTTPLFATGVTQIYNGGIPCDVTASSVYSNSGSSLWDWIRFENSADTNAIALDGANPGTYNGTTNKLIGFNNNQFLPVAISGTPLGMGDATDVPEGCTPLLQGYNSVLTIATQSMFDNFNIQHQIPQMSKQYGWITASLVNDHGICGFYRPDFRRRVSSSSGINYVDSFDFLTASTIGSTVDNANLRFIGEANEVTGSNILLQTGRLNLNVIENIDSASNTMTYPVRTSPYPVFTNQLNSFINWRPSGGPDVRGGLIATGSVASGQIQFTGLPTVGQKIAIRSTDGTLKTYVGANATDTTSNEFKVGGGSTATSAAEQLTLCINAAQGHNGKIIAEDLSSARIQLTQRDAGLNGNTVIDSDLSNVISATSFRLVGGTGLFRNQDAGAFNQLMFKRGNQFGYPTWRQVRQQDHPILVNERLNNKITAIKGSQLTEHDLRPVSMVGRPSFANFTYLTDPANFSTVQNATFKTSYSNEYVLFNTRELNEIANIDFSNQVTPFEQLVALQEYKPAGIPVYNLNWVLYQENLFPSLRNEFASASVTRVGYDSKFWRVNQNARVSGNVGNPNSLGMTGSGLGTDTTAGKLSLLTQSMWPLDAPLDFETRRTPALVTADVASSLMRSNSAGELQNTYSTYGIQNSSGSGTFSTSDMAASIRNAALYSRKHFLTSPRSLNSPGGIKPITVPLGIEQQPGPIETDPTAYGLAPVTTGSGEAKWDAAQNAGYLTTSNGITGFVSAPSEPFYDNYDEFRAEIKTVAKGYNIIPEFRISEQVENYIKFGILGGENTETFDIPGTQINSSQRNFYRDYSNSDFLENFLDVRQMTDLAAKEIKLTCRAAIKFHPYKGFYPAQRSLDLVTQFSKSYSRNIGVWEMQSSGTGSVFTAETFEQFGINLMQTIYAKPVSTPLFAPGILYNSIKSGLAVDYPVVTDHTRVEIQHITGTVNGEENYVFGTAHNTGSDFFNQYRTGSYFDKRLPFETIINPASQMKGVELNIFEPHPSQSFNYPAEGITSSIGNSPADNIYTLMASNYFAEVGKFFLNNSEYTKLEANGLTLNTFRFEPGEVYMARLRLRSSYTGSRTYDKEKGAEGGNAFYGVDGARDLGFGKGDTPNLSSFDFSNSGINLSGTFEIPQNPKRNKNFKQDFIMYSRPSAFGPAMSGRLYTSSVGMPSSVANNINNFALSASDFGCSDSISGFNWAYTPPYYDGESWADFIFKPTGSETYDLQRILTETQVITRRYDPGQAFQIVAGTGQPAAENVGVNTLNASRPPTVGGAFVRQYSPYSGININNNAMQIDAAINLFGIENVPKQRFNKFGQLVTDENEVAAQRWVIQPKFETPMMSFSDEGVRPVSNTNGTLTLPQNFGSESVPRGMWHQFGTLPEAANKGIFLEIGEIPKTWLRHHYEVIGSSSLYNDYNIDDGEDIHTKVKSFAELMGFTNQNSRVRLGELAERRIIKEAVVAVPYIMKDVPAAAGQTRPLLKEFISIPEIRYQAALSEAAGSAVGDSLNAAGKSIRNQVRKMKRYVLPPQLDFINNTDIDPIVMYLFEFRYELDKDDLSYIWQNLAPRNSRRMSLAEDAVAHELINTELLTEQNLFDNPNLRWMVFKVKQKSQAEYDNMITKQVSHPVNNLQLELQGTQQQPKKYEPKFNWPYDYVSIIETVKVEADILYKGDVSPPEISGPALGTPSQGVAPGINAVFDRPQIQGPELGTPAQGVAAPGSTTGRINDILDKAKRRARYANPTAKRADSKPVTAADSGPGPDFDLDRTE